MASLWPEPWRFTWAMASSSASTTATRSLRSRNSVAQSSSVATPAPGTTARAAVVAHQLDPVERRRDEPGRNASATDSWTTSDSAALHTDGRCVLALTTMARGHVEVGVLVDVDVAVAVAVDHVGDGGVARGSSAISDGPPRGIRQSIGVPLAHELDGRLAARVLDEDEGVLGQAGLGQRLAQHAGDGDVRRDRPDEPRRKAALPDLRHRPAASLVTLGRFS